MARRTPDWSPESEADYEVARRALKKRFAQWRTSVGAAPDKDAGEAPIHYKWAFLDGHLTRWSCADLDEVYLELHPAKVMVDDEDLDDVLDEAKAFVSFLDETGLLAPDSEPADVLVGPSRRHRGAVPPQHGRRLALQLRQATVDERGGRRSPPRRRGIGRGLHG